MMQGFIYFFPQLLRLWNEAGEVSDKSVRTLMLYTCQMTLGLYLFFTTEAQFLWLFSSNKVSSLLFLLPAPEPLLDIFCGPWLAKSGIDPLLYAERTRDCLGKFYFGYLGNSGVGIGKLGNNPGNSMHKGSSNCRVRISLPEIENISQGQSLSPLPSDAGA